MRKIFVWMSFLLVVSLLLGCSPSHQVNASVTATPATAVPSFPTEEAETIPPLNMRQANEIAGGEELMSIYDLGHDVFSCPEYNCTYPAFIQGSGDPAFLIIQSTNAQDTQFTTFEAEEIVDGNIQIGGSEIIGPYVNVSHHNEWMTQFTTADPMLNGVMFDVRGEQLFVLDTKNSAADPVSAVIWSPYYPDPLDDDELCISSQVRIEPGMLFGGDACEFEGDQWTAHPSPYYTYDYGTSELKPIAIKVPYTFDFKSHSWKYTP